MKKIYKILIVIGSFFPLVFLVNCIKDTSLVLRQNSELKKEINNKKTKLEDTKNKNDQLNKEIKNKQNEIKKIENINKQLDNENKIKQNEIKKIESELNKKIETQKKLGGKIAKLNSENKKLSDEWLANDSKKHLSELEKTKIALSYYNFRELITTHHELQKKYDYLENDKKLIDQARTKLNDKVDDLEKKEQLLDKLLSLIEKSTNLNDLKTEMNKDIRFSLYR